MTVGTLRGGGRGTLWGQVRRDVLVDK